MVSRLGEKTMLLHGVGPDPLMTWGKCLVGELGWHNVTYRDKVTSVQNSGKDPAGAWEC